MQQQFKDGAKSERQREIKEFDRDCEKFGIAALL
jgi:hypothetical protein